MSGFEVKTDVATTNLVPSTTKVIFSPGAPVVSKVSFFSIKGTESPETQIVSPESS